MTQMDSALGYLFGSEVKAKILRTLLLHPQESYHLRGLASVAKVESGNALKALRGLTAVHLVKSVPDSRGVRYQAEARSALFDPLRQLFLMAGELMADLKEVAMNLPAEQVLVFGSVARGSDTPDSDVDVLVIGDISSIEAQAAFKAVSRKHARQISVMAVEEETLARQVAEGSQFWRDVMENKVIELKGEGLHASLSARTLA
jgi:predicted nucleotidyltransferase